MLDRDRERLLLVWGTSCVLVSWLVFIAGILQADAASVGTAATGSRGRSVEAPAMLPGYSVGEFREPPARILTTIKGRERVRLPFLGGRASALRLGVPAEIVVPVRDLAMVAPYAKQTKLGLCVGPRALRVGQTRPRNTRYYFNSRIACAAYTAAILRHCGRPGGSFSASAQYAQLRKRGGKLVAAKVSTRYLPYYKFFRSGDVIVFHKGGGRIGHIEIFVGNGRVSGTSSSEGRVAIRRLSNRGFPTCSVLRI